MDAFCHRELATDQHGRHGEKTKGAESVFVCENPWQVSAILCTRRDLLLRF